MRCCFRLDLSVIVLGLSCAGRCNWPSRCCRDCSAAAVAPGRVSLVYYRPSLCRLLDCCWPCWRCDLCPSDCDVFSPVKDFNLLACILEGRDFLESPEGRDNDRDFPGPHISVAGVCTSGSDVPAVRRNKPRARRAHWRTSWKHSLWTSRPMNRLRHRQMEVGPS